VIASMVHQQQQQCGRGCLLSPAALRPASKKNHANDSAITTAGHTVSCPALQLLAQTAAAIAAASTQQ
jgi:hypothetical protein